MRRSSAAQRRIETKHDRPQPGLDTSRSFETTRPTAARLLGRMPTDLSAGGSTVVEVRFVALTQPESERTIATDEHKHWRPWV